MSPITFNEKFRKRTKKLALEVIRFYTQLPKNEAYRVLGRQILRSATSVAINFRAVCRTRSLKERYAKLCIVVEEVDETLFWLELFEESKLSMVPAFIKNETLEITKVMSNYRKTLKRKL